MRGRDVDCFHSSAHRGHEVVFGEDEAGAGDAERVGEFVVGVGGVCAGENATGAYDGEKQDRVGDAVEGVDANTIGGLEAGMAQAGDEMAD